MKTIIGTIGVAFLILSGCGETNSKCNQSSYKKDGIIKVKSSKVDRRKAKDIYKWRHNHPMTTPELAIANELNVHNNTMIKQNEIMGEILIELKKINKNK